MQKQSFIYIYIWFWPALHTCVHFVHTHTLPNTHTSLLHVLRIHSCMHKCSFTHTHTHTHTRTHAHTHTHTHTYIHTYIHTYTHTHAFLFRALCVLCSHSTHTHTHTYIHTQHYNSVRNADDFQRGPPQPIVMKPVRSSGAPCHCFLVIFVGKFCHCFWVISSGALCHCFLVIPLGKLVIVFSRSIPVDVTSLPAVVVQKSQCSCHEARVGVCGVCACVCVCVRVCVRVCVCGRSKFSMFMP